MPIDNAYSPVRLEADGTETDFDFDFEIYQNTDVKVSTVVRATDVATLKVLGVDYTVTINPVTEGGTVVFTSAPADTLDVLMESDLAYTQGVNLSARGTFKQDQVIQALDRNCRLIQQVFERTERSLVIPTEYDLSDLEIPEPLADALIGWNSAATNFENKVPTSVISNLDITLVPADANKLVGVNNAADGYEIKDINEYTSATITASDEIIFGDVDDSNNLKKDSVQGIIDLTSSGLSGDGTVETISETTSYWTVSANTSIVKTPASGLAVPLINITKSDAASGDLLLIDVQDQTRVLDINTTQEMVNEVRTNVDHPHAYGGCYRESGVFKWGNASLKFDGTDDYILFNDSSAWDIAGDTSTDWTIDFWVKFTDHTGSETFIAQNEDTNNRWNLYHTDGSGFRFIFTSGGVSIIDTSAGGEITDTDWHHVALVKDAQGATNNWGIYVDGTQVAYVQDNSTDTLSGGLYIGENGNNANFFSGNLDGLRMSSSNVFSATPVSGLTDTITVPTTRPGNVDSNTKLIMNGDIPNVVCDEPLFFGYTTHDAKILLAYDGTNWNVIGKGGEVRPSVCAFLSADQANLTNTTSVKININALAPSSVDLFGLLDTVNNQLTVRYLNTTWEFYGQVTFLGGTGLSSGNSIKVFINEDSTIRGVTEDSAHAGIASLDQTLHCSVVVGLGSAAEDQNITLVANQSSGASTVDVDGNGSQGETFLYARKVS